MNIAEMARLFADNPIQYFDYSAAKMFSLAPDELNELQLEAARYRFGMQRDKIPMLKKLADKQSITSIENVNDLLPLLFEHTMYKSYPLALLERGRFDQLTRWLDKLTTVDLSGVDASGCETIDEWLEVLDRETPIRLVHSSGTTGVMSFLPLHADEVLIRVELNSVFIREQCPGLKGKGTQEDPLNIHVISPYFRSGGKLILRLNDYTVRCVSGCEERFHAAYPGRISSDVEFLAARIRAAQINGTLDRLEINPKLLEQKAHFDQLKKEMPAHFQRFFAKMVNELKGESVYITGTSNMLYEMAESGLKQGMRKVFTPTSFVRSGGGAKGMVLPDDWQDKVKEFLGVNRINMGYGMSEITGLHPMCEEGHYHLLPWQIPFVLDPDTSQPLPRTGQVTGRAAFFDLVPAVHWGGFISGDEVTLNWDGKCPCGRTSPYILDNIERYSLKRGGDDKISCAATPDAHRDAMEFLNQFGT